MPGTLAAKTAEPDGDYIIPLGKGRIALEADETETTNGNTLTVITYGMGVHWALNASAEIKNQVEIVDLRTLFPLDEETVLKSVKKAKKCLIVTEEPTNNSFARSLAGLIQEKCFKYLDAPVLVIGSENMPAIPLNSTLEFTMIPNVDKVRAKMEELLEY